MRARKKKHGAERIAACAHLLIEDPAALITDPQTHFSKKRPLHLEIGCGKGNFACGMAAAHPDVNFIAMERVPDVACLALEKAEAAKDTRPDNLRFLIGNAENLVAWFPPHSIDCLYLNFSDPWPKSGHAKRRLTHRVFLEKYKTVLKNGGILRFKTDNVGLFDFSLEEFEALGLPMTDLTRDLHNSPLSAGNVMTEYEKNFSEKGFPIHAVTVHFKE
ncbi:MAG: tRNA (guanosine(46)-N7)-methyltransferase TrmB [Ruminococcaceae bacterium]|nr:tRNA (guanosine(46)-N7)-methyltransferase TrmB [Oscillospiraceae bacterium]